ncbi:MAG TPA: 3-hydroxyacyl-CoA dehydrogenase NAD-binding domain-containing protein, partial [Motiliproteus sp.]
MHTNHSTHAPLPTTTAVAVIGAGTMGAGIAQVAASHGHPVQLFDLNPEALQRGLDQIATGLAGQVKRGKLNDDQRTAILARLSPTSSLAALGDCGLVIEAIVEDLAIKRRLLADLETTCAADCILASNTSSISITALGAEMQHPERLVGMHFFNPAPVMKLVEVVSGLATAPATAAQVHA